MVLMLLLSKNLIVNKVLFTILLILSLSGVYSQWGDCTNNTDACTNPSFNITPSGFGNIEEEVVDL